MSGRVVDSDDEWEEIVLVAEVCLHFFCKVLAVFYASFIRGI